MKLRTLGLALLLPVTAAQADPAAFIGIGYTFGGNVGITAKVLSDDDENNGVIAAGATYYPYASNKFGLDLGVGYTFESSAVVVGWDFLQNKIQGSVGWADTDDDGNDNSPGPIAAPAPAPAPGA